MLPKERRDSGQNDNVIAIGTSDVRNARANNELTAFQKYPGNFSACVRRIRHQAVGTCSRKNLARKRAYILRLLVRRRVLQQNQGR